HTAYFRLVQQPEIVAQIQGSNLAYHILAQLQIARNSPPAARKLVIFSGHDTNIANVAALLKLSWKLPDLPNDDTPPAGALVFELYSGASPDDDYVRIRYVHQTVPQLRSLERRSAPQPPFWVDLTLSGCKEICGFQQFSGILHKAIVPRFVTRTRAQ
ncbi:MAG TPA: histidine-type phosphatase, partial [Candidatus Angelobacter sp.]|nr:histidine-type phosphatase [Candidatus Angelobacter sp.]